MTTKVRIEKAGADLPLMVQVQEVTFPTITITNKNKD